MGPFAWLRVLRLVLPIAYLAGCGSADSGSPTGGAGTGGGAGTSGQAGTAGPGAGGAGTGGGLAGTGGGPVAGTTGTGGGGAAGTGTAGAGAGGRGGATAGTTGTGGGGAAGGAAGAGAGGRGGATAGTTGTGGSGAAGTGAAGTGPVATVCNGGPPSPAAGGANFPFPQHRALGACIFPPTCSDNDMTMGWAAFKTNLIVSDGGTDGALRVRRPEDGDDTVSEGISYGMLFAVYMNDKATFDALWKYEQKHLDMRGLMHWRINASGTTGGMNSATDADEDIAFALVMADKQWGGYTTVAKDMLALVAMHDFQADGTIRGGDTYNAVNPSYLAPAFYKVFATYTGDTARWTTILNKSYEILAMVANATTGLVPDWSAGRTGPNYLYDAARTPYRIALDACWTGDQRAVDFSRKIGMFFNGIGANNIGDGYQLNGTPTSTNKNSTFIGTAGTAGMPSNLPTLVAGAYTFAAAEARATNASYYNRSWALFTVLFMTGNFVNFAGP